MRYWFVVLGLSMGCANVDVPFAGAEEGQRIVPIGDADEPAGASPCAISVGHDGVYWTNRGDGSYGTGSIMYLPEGARWSRTIASGEDFPCALAADPEGVSWATYGPVESGTLFRMEHDSAGPFALANIGVVRGLAAAAGRLYWGDPTEGSVRSASFAGGSVELVASEQYGVGPMVATESAVFWATISRIVRFDPTSKSWSVLWQGAEPVALTAHGNDVVWITRAGAVLRASVDGAEVLAGESHEAAHAIATDGERAYFTGMGSVNAVPLAGGSVTTLALVEGEPRALAVDASNVYWSDAESGSIAFVTKGSVP